MPFDGSGNFNRTQDWTNDEAASIKIRADRHDNNDDDIAAGLSNCITKNGQTTVTADIPWNGHKLTGVANPVNPQDAATKSYADAIRAFNTAISLTGNATGSAPNQASTALINFNQIDMSIVARVAGSPATPAINRIAFNDALNGTGTDVLTITETGQILSPLDSAQPMGTMVVTMVTATVPTWTKPKGLKYLEVIGCAPGGSGAPAIAAGAGVASFGSPGGAGAWGRRLFTNAELPASLTITIGTAGASVSSGNGQAGGACTFGALITLPGGLGGNQGANTTTFGTIGGGAATAAPTGVTLGSPGEGGNSASAFVSGNVGLLGAAGSGPFGAGSAMTMTSGFGSQNGLGYGAGGGGAFRFNGALIASGAGAPGFFLLREYY